jgi:hypothetical protein
MSISKSLGSILASQESRLQSTLERACQLEAISRQLQQALGSPLGEHVSLGNLRENMAIILADSPAWAGKARYEAAIILNTLRQLPGLEGIQKVQFKVRPLAISSPEPHTAPRRLKLSQSNAQVLKYAAAGITDPELSAALQRLADHARDTKS